MGDGGRGWRGERRSFVAQGGRKSIPPKHIPGVVANYHLAKEKHLSTICTVRMCVSQVFIHRDARNAGTLAFRSPWL